MISVKGNWSPPVEEVSISVSSDELLKKLKNKWLEDIELPLNAYPNYHTDAPIPVWCVDEDYHGSHHWTKTNEIRVMQADEIKVDQAFDVLMSNL
jgi:hypothetical protein